jgi:hypothetical protein
MAAAVTALRLGFTFDAMLAFLLCGLMNGCCCLVRQPCLLQAHCCMFCRGSQCFWANRLMFFVIVLRETPIWKVGRAGALNFCRLKT